MRDILEGMRDRLTQTMASCDYGKDAALIGHDGITEMIDKAEELSVTVVEPSAVVQVTSIDIMMALLDDKLQPIRNQLTRALAPKKRRDTAVRNKKARVTARTAQRKLKRGTR